MKDTLTGDLENVVVSVNKWEQKMNEIPNTILKVDLTEARLQNPQLLPICLQLPARYLFKRAS